jgi:Xaa-Pro aminopeptidase
MSNIFAQRRQEFMRRMNGGIAIIPAHTEVTRSYDTHFPFRQSNDFQYLTGFPEPDAVALFIPEHKEHKFVLFVRPKNAERETWDGRRFGPDGAKKEFGADEAHSIEKLDEMMPKYLENRTVLYHEVGARPAFDARVFGWLRAVKALERKGVDHPSNFFHPSNLTHEMRLRKDGHCIETMRAAAQLSKDAHRHGMKITKAGMNEANLQAEMEHYCRVRGSRFNAYNSIVAGGDNGTILHYTENNKPLNDGELVLVDLGCELDHYASDITRTWPVNGEFTAEQKLIYDLVLQAQHDAILAARAGNTIRHVHEVSAKTLAEGLIEIGVIKGDAELHMRVCIGDNEEYKFPEGEPVLKDFFMHGTSHWLGMDVHDCGRYRPGGNWRVLEPGMCITVEPGLYFGKGNAKAPERFRGIGVRIEDDIHITTGDPEVLTKGLPRTTEEVEACCARG